MNLLITIAALITFIYVYQRWSKHVEERRRREHEAYVRTVVADPKHYVARPADFDIRRKYIKDRDGNRCKQCGDNTGLQVHHIVPVNVRPDHSEGNLITLCIYCHSKQPGIGHGQGLINAEISMRCKKFYFTKRKSRNIYSCDRCRGTIDKGDFSYVSRRMYDNKRICERCLLRC